MVNPVLTDLPIIRRRIEVVITRTTRNRLSGETLRGFESHRLRQNCMSRLSRGAIIFQKLCCRTYQQTTHRMQKNCKLR